eukprot:scaffold16865_cov229-Ochromonas_danica.AAC.3
MGGVHLSGWNVCSFPSTPVRVHACPKEENNTIYLNRSFDGCRNKAQDVGKRDVIITPCPKGCSITFPSGPTWGLLHVPVHHETKTSIEYSNMRTEKIAMEAT